MAEWPYHAISSGGRGLANLLRARQWIPLEDYGRVGGCVSAPERRGGQTYNAFSAAACTGGGHWGGRMTRDVLGRLLLAGIISIVAALSSTSIRTSAARTQEDLAAFDAQANQIVEQIVAGDFAGVRGQFDATMMDQLSEEGLANAWRTYQELLGT